MHNEPDVPVVPNAPDFAPHRSARRTTAILALLYLCFVVYGSLVPLNFVAMPFDKAVVKFQNVLSLAPGIDSRADWATNFLLLIPFAFLCNHLAASRNAGPGKYLMSIIVFMVSVGLACAVEFAQVFFPGRTVSQNDVWAQSLGSLVGIFGQLRFGATFDAWLTAVSQHESRRSRLLRALNVYLAILFAFSVLPLDLTISPVELYHKWSEGRILFIPFAGLKGDMAARVYETLTDILIWVPAGLLWSLDATRPIGRVALRGLVAAVAIELTQLFVYSRVTDVTDVLLAVVGTTLGAALAPHIRNLLPRGALPPLVWRAAWIFWAVLVLAIFWFPYDFSTSQVSLWRAYSNFSQPLLANYYLGSEYHAASELLRKTALFLPGGVFWVAAFGGSGRRWLGMIGGAVVFLAEALLIETGQLFLPSKYADLTDVLIMTAGGLLGMWVTAWVLSGQEIASSYAQPRASGVPQANFRAASATNGTRGNHRSTVSLANRYLIAFLALALAIGTTTRLPFVPYNVRELVVPGAYGVLSIAGLSLFILWQIAGHGIFLRWCDNRNAQMIFLPVWLLAHGGVGWLLLRPSVPVESLHDILGSPVLGWVWETEMIVRFLALDAVFALPLLGATLLVSVAGRRSRAETLVSCLFWSVMLAWPLHWAVVANAATDNLTELMHGGGSFMTSLQLAGGLFSFFLAGGIASYGVVYRCRPVPALLAIVAALSASVACFWFGTEQIILKYGKVFSAWQFLLSADREHYVSGLSLLARFLVAYDAALAGYIIVHTLLWKTKEPDFNPAPTNP